MLFQIVLGSLLTGTALGYAEDLNDGQDVSPMQPPGSLSTTSANSTTVVSSGTSARYTGKGTAPPPPWISGRPVLNPFGRIPIRANSSTREPSETLQSSSQTSSEAPQTLGSTTSQIIDASATVSIPPNSKTKSTSEVNASVGRDEPASSKTSSLTEERSTLPKTTSLKSNSTQMEGHIATSTTISKKTTMTRPRLPKGTPPKLAPGKLPAWRGTPKSKTSKIKTTATMAEESTSVSSMPISVVGSNSTSVKTNSKKAKSTLGTKARPTKTTSTAPRPTAKAGHGLSDWEKKIKNPTFQIILSGVPDLKVDAKSITPNVDIYDIDLFMTETKTIQTLKRLNKTVICYFSAGTYEPGRPDSVKFTAADKGRRLKGWPNEKWLKLSSANIRRIMSDRIQLAHQKGCDAIDPDNIDGYGERGGGFSLTKVDSIAFVRWIAQTTKKYNMAVGIKNALEMLADVKDYVHFAVNEECVRTKECDKYADFMHKDKKPVFHIEYPLIPTDIAPLPRERKRYCAESSPKVHGTNFQSVMKHKKLDGWVVYCSGQVSKTPTIDKGSSRFSLRGNYAIISNLTEQDTGNPIDPNPSPSIDITDNAAYQAEIAREDGYPFPPGKGSEQFISDDELFTYTLNTNIHG